MIVAVVDVGSNTARLLVAVRRGSELSAIREDKAYLALGAEIERNGRVSRAKLAETEAVTRRFAETARKLGADPVEVIVTAPGRQTSEPDVLVDTLARATRASVRVLSAEEEGLLAYEGALSRAGTLLESVAVCDVGGGSTEIVVGAPPSAPTWVRSVDLGALRLTARVLGSDPPKRRELHAATEEAQRCLAGIVPPRPKAALAVGGSARALAKLVGPKLDERQLRKALELATARRATKVAKAYGIDEERARVLPAGAIILTELTLRLGVPLQLARGGLREGAALALLAQAAAA
ncbi:MAG: hypothetical protein H0T39_15360 [Actinobacteria bacterium]|nr:hypothetical protein [Actinomycetota bacterium]